DVKRLRHPDRLSGVELAAARGWRRATGFGEPVLRNPSGAITALDLPPGETAAGPRAAGHGRSGTRRQGGDNAAAGARAGTHVQRFGDAHGVIDIELAARRWRATVVGRRGCRLFGPVLGTPPGTGRCLHAPPDISHGGTGTIEHL